MEKRVRDEITIILFGCCHCKVYVVRKDQFKVKDGHTKFVVNLAKKTYESNV